MKQYVWLNVITGEFSNSWSEEDHIKYAKYFPELLKEAEKTNHKLIEYTCLNDNKFTFYNQMKLK